LAIRSIKPPDPLKKLVLARKHAVEEWTLPALLELCERPEPLSLEEVRLLDFEDVVLVGSVRQAVRSSTLMVDAAGIGNCVRAWKSGKPCTPQNNPLIQIQLPQSGTLSLPTEQPIFNGGSVSTQPTRTIDDFEWGGKKKRGKRR
jgi:hypothetical protein